MRKAALYLIIILAAGASAGCGDNWPKILTNEVTLAHEYIDVLMKIVDEDSAAYYKKYYLDRIKNAWGDLQKRKELYAKLRFNSIIADIKTKEDAANLKIPKDAIEEFSYALNPNYVREVLAVLPRLNQQTQRIRDIVRRLQAEGAETKNIETIPEYHKQVFTGGGQVRII
jgi:hypothetical protein